VNFTIRIGTDAAILDQLVATIAQPNFKTNGAPGDLSASSHFRLAYCDDENRHLSASYLGSRTHFANRWAAAVIAANDGDTNSRTIDP
jgi:hypothetical protein